MKQSLIAAAHRVLHERYKDLLPWLSLQTGYPGTTVPCVPRCSLSTQPLSRWQNSSIRNFIIRLILTPKRLTTLLLTTLNSNLVSPAGFEPATPWLQTKNSTRLSYREIMGLLFTTGPGFGRLFSLVWASATPADTSFAPFFQRRRPEGRCTRVVGTQSSTL